MAKSDIHTWINPWIYPWIYPWISISTATLNYGDPPEKFDPCIPPYKVTQIYLNCHRSIGKCMPLLLYGLICLNYHHWILP